MAEIATASAFVAYRSCVPPIVRGSIHQWTSHGSPVPSRMARKVRTDAVQFGFVAEPCVKAITRAPTKNANSAVISGVITPPARW